MSQQTRRRFLRIATATATGSIVGVAAADDAATVSHHETFANGLDGWSIDADVADGVEEGTDWSVGVTEDRSLVDGRAASLTLDATAGHGGIWIAREFDVEPGTAYYGDIGVSGWSPVESEIDLSRIRVYAGPESPTSLEDFPTALEAWRLHGEVGGLVEPLNRTEGWDEFQTGWETPALSTDTITLAVGIQSAWEIDLEHAIDDVVIELEPR
ncbi:hypothetical protein C479_09128 [Halovivax asiaticus JCM 14624]|uniref:CBM11 domain-containing protein n=1 Tax=Halovivax asiaticus JCM 14624 TaxID=1227490 RepID=M0BJ91_9EURY|nr:hypothetical protein [Halovivax asiaticus]ELZ10961.1 hypothetical protein C479_09128 [Halovivax asiaticus JCM 14624]